jgi:hypothetical protein
MLWFYYFLARSEERRMEALHAEVYRQEKQHTWMFLPGQPGRFQKIIFGWIRDRRARLIVIYALSIIGATGAAFLLREASFRLTDHLVLLEQKIAAVSFLSGDNRELRALIQSAEAVKDNRLQIRRQDGWILVQAMQGKGAVVHVMIDAGMTRQNARDLNLDSEGIKLVFSQSIDRKATEQPFSIYMRWRPALIAEMNDGKVSRELPLESDLFIGNPVMPVF